jgi:hypothetical protein
MVGALEHGMKPPAVPLATYRLQMTAAFGFDHAAALVPYLQSLGVSHLYASPFLKARAGSTHGYDIVDHAQLNPELGGAEGFARLSAALAQAGIGLILDFVPNHVGVHYADNAWWLDVLEWGPRSPHADAFDIDWDIQPFRHGEVVLLPILGRPYGDALESGELVLKYDAAEGSFSVWYYEHRLPIRPDRYGEMLRAIVGAANAAEEPAGRRLLELAGQHRHPRSPSRADAPAFKAALAGVDGGAGVIERGIGVYRPRPDDRASAQALHRLLERQYYRVAHWRTASSEINYRRFFDVNGLAGLRVENLDTFEAVHALVGRLISEGRLQGLRLDHIDGLRDPIQYSRRLQRLIRDVGGGSREPFYVIVEKILAEGERMPRLPGVAGTTGYEWLNVIARVLVDDNGLEPLERLRREITENPRSFPQIFQRAHHAPARAHCRRALQYARLYDRPAARRPAAVHPAFPGLSHVHHHGWRVERRPRHHRPRPRGSARAMVRFGPGHLRLPARRADARSRSSGPKRIQQRAGATLCLEGAAVHRPDDGQILGRHGVLSLPSPAGAERGGRRAGSTGPFDRGIPSPHGCARRRGAARPHRHRHPRYQTRRGCAHAHIGDRRTRPRMGGRGAVMA